MDKKQQKALKVIRKIQKKMEEAQKKHDAEEVERLCREMWANTSTFSNHWVASWSVPPSTFVTIGVDFNQKKEEKK